MKKRIAGVRLVAWLWMAGAAGLVAAGCAIIPTGTSLPGVALPGTMLDIHKAMGGSLSPETEALIKTVGPIAMAAIAALADAWERRMAEQRAEDARQEEDRRARTAAAQNFYADVCRSKPVQPGKPGSSGREKEAETAFAAANYKEAARLLQEEYDARKANDKDPELARIANKLALAVFADGDGARAMAVASQALKIRQDRAGEAEKSKQNAQIIPANLELAESFATTALVYRGQGAFKEAKENSQKALKLRIQYLGGENHECVAQSQNDLGEILISTGDYLQAHDVLRRAYATRQQKLPPDHRDLAQSQNDLGAVYKHSANYARAKDYYEKALAARKKLGADHPELADTYHDMASLYRAMGEFKLAQENYQKALEIRKKKFGEDGREVAATQADQAEFYLTLGDYAEAEKLANASLEIRKKKLGSDHPEVAASLVILAKIEQAKGDFGAAESNTQTALQLQEKKFGKESILLAVGTSALGKLYLAEGNFEKAETCFKKAQEIQVKKWAEQMKQPNHPAIAGAIDDLGLLHYARGQYAEAEKSFTQALQMRKALGDTQPQLADSYGHLALVQVALGRTDAAIQSFREAAAQSQRVIEAVGAGSGEARLDAVLRLMREQEEEVYTLLTDPQSAPGAAPLAMALALLRKGQSVDQSAALSETINSNLSPEAKQKYSELKMLRSQIARARLTPNASEEMKPEELKALGDQAAKIEQELAQEPAMAMVRARRAAPGLETVVQKVSASLPPAGVLVEMVRFRTYQFKAKSKEPRWGEARYVAMALDGKGAIQTADLGPTTGVEAAVKSFLAKATDTSAPLSEVQKDSRALDAKVIAPIRPFLGGAKSLVLSLDGQLNLVPFAALYDGKQYLIDSFDLQYVTSGRDLLPRPPLPGKRSREIALFGKPAYSKSGAVPRGKASRGLMVVDGPAVNGSRTQIPSGALVMDGIAPLPGTEQEARAIHRLFGKGKMWLGNDATKDRFLGLQAPAVVHVGTHGYFRPDKAEQGSRGLVLVGGPRGPDPLLNSMLLWANVAGKRIPEKGEDAVALEPSGISTALEVAGMNLAGTQLVVLSACESGRGEVDDMGQGVYGLRRAVVAAGAETLVTSLWEVSDQVTRDLMISYYRNLLAGQGRVEALRHASLAVRSKHPEPVYWAPFIAIGQVGPLKLK